MITGLFIGSYEREDINYDDEPVEQPEIERHDAAFVMIVQKQNHLWQMRFSDKVKSLSMSEADENVLITHDKRYALTFDEKGFDLAESRKNVKGVAKNHKYRYTRKGLF